MSDLIVCVEWRGHGCRCRMTRLNGVVIGCTETSNGCFEITVLFFFGDQTRAAAAFRHLPN